MSEFKLSSTDRHILLRFLKMDGYVEQLKQFPLSPFATMVIEKCVQIVERAEEGGLERDERLRLAANCGAWLMRRALTADDFAEGFDDDFVSEFVRGWFEC